MIRLSQPVASELADALSAAIPYFLQQHALGPQSILDPWKLHRRVKQMYSVSHYCLCALEDQQYFETVDCAM